jgi:hypothetical protein
MSLRSVATLCLASTILSAPALAHDFWANGEPVPPWVKAQCCGPRDVHHLRAGAVHIMADGYHIDGLNTVIPISRALPSPDGNYWAFWNPVSEPDPAIFCFFAPLNGF